MSPLLFKYVSVACETKLQPQSGCHIVLPQDHSIMNRSTLWSVPACQEEEHFFWIIKIVLTGCVKTVKHETINKEEKEELVAVVFP